MFDTGRQLIASNFGFGNGMAPLLSYDIAHRSRKKRKTTNRSKTLAFVVVVEPPFFGGARRHRRHTCTSTCRLVRSAKSTTSVPCQRAQPGSKSFWFGVGHRLVPDFSSVQLATGPFCWFLLSKASFAGGLSCCRGIAVEFGVLCALRVFVSGIQWKLSVSYRTCE